MGSQIDQRKIATSRLKLDEEGAPARADDTNPDDVDTDRSLAAIALELARTQATQRVQVEQQLEQTQASERLQVERHEQAQREERAQLDHAAEPGPAQRAYGEPIEGHFDEPYEESPWRLNALGAALLTALLGCLLVTVALKVKLNQTRAALAEAESAAEAAESAVAREPEPSANPRETVPSAARRANADPSASAAQPGTPAVATAANGAAPIDAPGSEGAHDSAVHDGSASPASASHPAADTATRTATDAAGDGHKQLVLLLTVGTQHFAEKQLLRLRHVCSAPLAVYRQKRGRCAYSQCFAVAAPFAEARAAHGCGEVLGQSVRDRDDFVLP